MTTGCIFQVVLLLCFSTMALSKSYALLQFQQSNSACQKLLAKLSGRPERCLDDRMNFQLPEVVKDPHQFQKADIAFTVYEMLKNILDVFRKDISNTGWDTAIIKDLLTELHRQMDYLETILEGKLDEKNLTWGNIKTILQLKSHYWKMVEYLKNKDYSSCAWTIVRVEILRNFSFMSSLAENLEK